MSTVEERLASLEARMDGMADLRTLITDLDGDTNRQFTELRGDMQRQFTELRGDMQRQLDVTLSQFTELRGDMNRRFEQVDRRFEALDQKGDRQFTWVVGIQVALLLGVVGAMVGAYFR
jgi:nitrate/nitrite-specific signal transduction histidine kinase